MSFHDDSFLSGGGVGVGVGVGVGSPTNRKRPSPHISSRSLLLGDSRMPRDTLIDDTDDHHHELSAEKKAKFDWEWRAPLSPSGTPDFTSQQLHHDPFITSSNLLPDAAPRNTSDGTTASSTPASSPSDSFVPSPELTPTSASAPTRVRKLTTAAQAMSAARQAAAASSSKDTSATVVTSPSGGLTMRVKVACSNCKTSKTKCDNSRPCGRCVRTDRAACCADPIIGFHPARQPEEDDEEPTSGHEALTHGHFHHSHGADSHHHHPRPSNHPVQAQGAVQMISFTANSLASQQFPRARAIPASDGVSILQQRNNNGAARNGNPDMPAQPLPNSWSQATDQQQAQQQAQQQQQQHGAHGSHFHARPPLPRRTSNPVTSSSSTATATALAPLISMDIAHVRDPPMSSRAQQWLTAFLDVFLANLQSWHVKLSEEKAFENITATAGNLNSTSARIDHASLLVRRSKFFADLIIAHVNSMAPGAEAGLITADISSAMQGDKDVYGSLHVGVLSMSLGPDTSLLARPAWANQALASILGYPSPSAVEDLFSNLEGVSLVYPESNLQTMIPAFMNSVFGGLSNYAVQTEWRTRDGRPVPMLESVNIHYDASGSVCRTTSLLYALPPNSTESTGQQQQAAGASQARSLGPNAGPAAARTNQMRDLSKNQNHSMGAAPFSSMKQEPLGGSFAGAQQQQPPVASTPQQQPHQQPVPRFKQQQQLPSHQQQQQPQPQQQSAAEMHPHSSIFDAPMPRQ